MSMLMKRRMISGCLYALLLLPAMHAQAVPEIATWQTPNGARVLFIEARSLPMVDIRVVFSAGSARDGDQPGLALLTNALLSSGAGGLDADQIAEGLEDIGAQLGNESLRDMAVVSLRSLSEKDKLEKALDIMRKVIVAPVFPATDLARDRERLLTSIRGKQQRPGSVAGDVFYAALYGDHPYALPSEGDETSLRSIKRADVQAFHRRYYVASNAVLAIVGDLSRKDAEDYANRLLKALPEGEPGARLPSPATIEAREIRLNMPVTQTHIMVGQPVMRRGDRDYFALYVGNHILGGSGLTSRLMQSIREDRGLVYDVHSYFLPMAAEGPFIAGMQTRNEQAGDALELLRAEIKRFIEEGPAADELEKAISNITGSFPLNIDSNANLAQYLALIGFYQLPLNYLEAFNENIRAVTADAVKDAFKRRLDPDSFITVIVGGAVEP